MSIEHSKETISISDSNELIKNSSIKIYYNNEKESIESITIQSEERDEITLFPMILESGQEYMPNLDEYYWEQTLENDNSTHSKYSLSLGEMENNVFYVAMLDDFNRSFLQFARYNLPLEDYARFIVEQEGVNQHFLEADRRGEISDEILLQDYNETIMHWPDYYPGKEKYRLEFLPTAKEFYPLYLFNRLGYIFNHRAQYELEVERFEYKELLFLEAYIQNNYDNEPSELFNKIREHYNVDARGINHMMQYIETWKELSMMEYHKERYIDTLKNIPKWRTE
jgi:hypothetical protein